MLLVCAIWVEEEVMLWVTVLGVLVSMAVWGDFEILIGRINKIGWPVWWCPPLWVELVMWGDWWLSKWCKSHWVVVSHIGWKFQVTCMPGTCLAVHTCLECVVLKSINEYAGSESYQMEDMTLLSPTFLHPVPLFRTIIFNLIYWNIPPPPKKITLFCVLTLSSTFSRSVCFIAVRKQRTKKEWSPPTSRCCSL